MPFSLLSLEALLTVLEYRLVLESALDSSSALSGTPSAPTKPWPEWDIAAEPEPYEESYLPGTLSLTYTPAPNRYY